MPDGVLINGKGPYRYNTTLVPDGIEYETINVDPGIVTSPFIGHNFPNMLCNILPFKGVMVSFDLTFFVFLLWSCSQLAVTHCFPVTFSCIMLLVLCI